MRFITDYVGDYDMKSPLKSRRKKKINKNNRLAREGDKINSNLLLVRYIAEIEKFYGSFSECKECFERLLEWRGGWRERGSLVTFKCPNNKCSGTKGKIYKRNKEGEKIRIVYECRTCRKQTSLYAGTIFENTKLELWIWFLSIYSMILLDGGIPITFLTNKYLEFAVSTYDFETSYKDDEKNIKRFRQRVKRITTKIKEQVFKGKNSNYSIDDYCKLVGLKRITNFKSFLEWYNADPDCKKTWKIGWRDFNYSIPKKNNSVNTKQSCRPKEKIRHQLFVSRSDVAEGDWILCVDLKAMSQKIKLRWMLVEHISLLSSKVFDCEYYATQKKYQDKSVMKRRPFKITKDFRYAFRKAILYYFKDKSHDFSRNGIVGCPPEIVEYTLNKLHGRF